MVSDGIEPDWYFGVFDDIARPCRAVALRHDARSHVQVEGPVSCITEERNLFSKNRHFEAE